MSNLTASTVGELAAQLPQATRILEKYGIDYCCGGRRSIVDACAAAGISVDELTSQIEKDLQPPPVEDYPALSQRELIAHIVVTHHAFTREELTRLRALVHNVTAVHEARHPELILVHATFDRLSEELIPHMLKEENVLFPYIAALESAFSQNRRPDPPPFVTVRYPVRMMTIEHEVAGTLLQELRRLTSDFTPPVDACVSYRTLYAALENLETDLHQHIHLENNILFVRAVQQETDAPADQMNA